VTGSRVLAPRKPATAVALHGRRVAVRDFPCAADRFGREIPDTFPFDRWSATRQRSHHGLWCFCASIGEATFHAAQFKSKLRPSNYKEKQFRFGTTEKADDSFLRQKYFITEIFESLSFSHIWYWICVLCNLVCGKNSVDQLDFYNPLSVLSVSQKNRWLMLAANTLRPRCDKLRDSQRLVSKRRCTLAVST
jgi:hypothetical protein